MARTKNDVKKLDTKEVEEVKQINVEEIKTELKTYVDDEVKKETRELFRAYNKEVLKPKRRKIIKLRLIIALLLILYIVTILFLFKDHYFDKYIIKFENKFLQRETLIKDDLKVKDNTTKEDEAKKREEEQRQLQIEKEQKLNNLKNKYQNLFQNVIITTNNNYKNEYYSGKFSNNFYLSLGVELLNESDIVYEQGIITVSGDKLIEKVKLVTTQTINNDSFIYKDVSFKYIKSLNTYILDKELVKDGIQIQREVVNIEEGTNITIDTVEYYVKEGKKYNPVTDKEIEDNSISSNTFMTHEFVLSNGSYYLIK